MIIIVNYLKKIEMFFIILFIYNLRKMDQPHNQFLYKELVYSQITQSMPSTYGPVYYDGYIIKINLYSTGNIDLFKKELVTWTHDVQTLPIRLISLFYSIPKVLSFNKNPQGIPDMDNINNYLDKITFVPTEHISSFYFSKIPINSDIVQFIEYILERNKGIVVEKDFEIIHHSVQKETEILELYNQTLYLNKLINFLLYLLGLFVLLIIIYFIIQIIYKIYKKLYFEHYEI